MFITDWQITSVSGGIEAFAWRTEDAKHQPEDTTSGTLVVDYNDRASDERAQFYPVRYAAYKALVSVKDDAIFSNVFEGVVSDAERETATEDDQSVDSLDDLLGQLDLDDIDTGNQPSPLNVPWDNETDNDTYDTFWESITTDTHGHKKMYQDSFGSSPQGQ